MTNFGKLVAYRAYLIARPYPTPTAALNSLGYAAFQMLCSRAEDWARFTLHAPHSRLRDVEKRAGFILAAIERKN